MVMNLYERAPTNRCRTLEAQGCSVADDGHLPVTIRGPIRPHNPTNRRLPIEPVHHCPADCGTWPQFWVYTNHRDNRRISVKTVHQHYPKEMHKRGVQAEWIDEHRLQVPPANYQDGSVSVEGDATAATYFAALATLHSRSTLTNLGRDSRQETMAF